MSAREHNAPGQPPNWSRVANAFRTLDGKPVKYSREPNCLEAEAEVIREWRKRQPSEPRERDGEPRNWAELYAFFSGALITLLGALILLAIAGVHP